MSASYAGSLGCPTCSHLQIRPQAQRVVRCSARRSAEEPDRRLEPVKLVLSGLAAAMLLQGTYTPSAEAGVVIEKSGGKKLFQGAKAKVQAAADDAAAAVKPSGGGFSLPSVSLPSLPGLPGAPSLPSPPSISLSPPSGAFDPLTLTLPVVVAIIGGGGFLASKLDVGFAEFFSGSIVKDSGGYAGYEETLKGENEGFAGLELPLGLPNPFADGEASNGKTKKMKKGGTQALKLKPKKAAKSAGGLLGGLFGGKK